jgi:two-component system response regulator RegA
VRRYGWDFLSRDFSPSRMVEAPPSTRNLLLVDDDAVFSRVLARALRTRDFEVQVAATIAETEVFLGRGDFVPDFAVLDLNLGSASGLKLIGMVRQAAPDCRILILTGYASIATAIDAIKLGADEYLAKPAEVDTIVHALLGEREPDADAIPQATPSVSRLEWEHIQRVLAEQDGNVSATARVLKMHRRTLQRKLAKRPARS